MDPQQVRLMKVVLLVSSVASLLVLAMAAYQENFRSDWRHWQTEYAAALEASAGDDASLRASAKAFRLEPKQIYLAELGEIDRCTTCHLGVENPAMASAALPLTKHSGSWLTQHPPDQFGCTVCHDGQGRATSRIAAHGWRDDGEIVAKMETPLLRGEDVYTGCGRCHDEIDLYGGQRDLFAARASGAGDASARKSIRGNVRALALPTANALKEGKRLTVSLGCLGCHQYRERGGPLGPDLTYVGDKSAHGFSFAHVKGQHTVRQWMFEHFTDPQGVSPDTLMPDMGLTDAQAEALTLYMLSLRRKTAPASHMPAPRLEGEVVPVRGETLYAMFCSACHGAEGYGTTMRTGLWPTNGDPWGRDSLNPNVVREQRGDLDILVPSLHHPDTLATMSDEYLRKIIAEGRPGTKMIGWQSEGGLSDDEVTLLVAYLRSWQTPTPDIDAVASAYGEPRVGAALFRANCAACHGRNGEGGVGVSLNSPTFLAVASDAFLRDTIVQGRPNTAMPAWREFNGQEISDMLAHMRQWQGPKSHLKTAVALCAGDEDANVSANIGQTLYQANCVTCHGADGQGDLGPSLNTQAFLTVVSDDYLVETMLEGRPGTGMPSWRHMSDADVASIVRYVRTWQHEESKPEGWRETPVPRGDWDAGRSLFVGICAGCHGQEGEGSAGPQLNNPVFLRVASDNMLREWITHGKEGTPMLGFRKGGQGITELSDRQIEDIVAYLRSLERAGPTEIPRVAKSPNGRPEKGAVVYAISCVGCHGTRGEGASGPALSNPNFLRFASDGFLMATLALGRSGTEMRPVKRGAQSILELSSDEVNDVVAYLRSWENDPPFKPGDAGDIPHRFVIPWDLKAGRRLFRSNCAGCHGEEGKGLWAPELNNEGFLAAVTDGALQATIIRGRKGTAMRPFGAGSQGLADLSGEEVDNIVAYIRQWSTRAPSPMTIPAQHSREDEDVAESSAEPANVHGGQRSAESPATGVRDSISINININETMPLAAVNAHRKEMK